jgi:hypothetical protein
LGREAHVSVVCGGRRTGVHCVSSHHHAHTHARAHTHTHTHAHAHSYAWHHATRSRDVAECQTTAIPQRRGGHEWRDNSSHGAWWRRRERYTTSGMESEAYAVVSPG